MKLRRLRLVTGLILMAFVIGHMANLMLGMHSLAAMESWRPWLIGRASCRERVSLTV